MSDPDILTLTAEIVASYLGGDQHRTAPSEIPGLIRAVRSALSEGEAPTSSSAAAEADFPKPSKREISKSITPDALISFVDGKSYKTLKRHLTRHGMDLATYRERYGLPSDYPSVASSYSAARSAMAKSLGLGARRKTAAAPEPAPAPKAKAPRAKKKPAEAEA